MRRSSIVLVFLILSVFLNATDRVNIIDILNNPGKIGIGKLVEVIGMVEQWVPTSGTSYYLLKGDYGGIIKVNSESKPETGKRYIIQAFVQKDALKNVPILVEKSRNFSSPKVSATTTPTTTTTKKNNVLYILLGFLVIGLVGLIVYQINAKKQTQTVSTPSSSQASHTETIPPQQDDLKTVKLTAGPPKTMKFIPGKLEIISHEDKGKSFRFAGYPTPTGNVVTIGRKSVSGDRAFAHIQIDENRFSTVSRQQAEIRERNGEVYLKNLSETNLSQLNGEELQLGEERQVKFGDTLRMGELEFKYSK